VSTSDCVTRDLATVVRTPDEGCGVYRVRFIGDDTIGRQVSDFVGFFGLTRFTHPWSSGHPT
jgi:hypothetical protein